MAKLRDPENVHNIFFIRYACLAEMGHTCFSCRVCRSIQKNTYFKYIEKMPKNKIRDKDRNEMSDKEAREKEIINKDKYKLKKKDATP